MRLAAELEQQAVVQRLILDLITGRRKLKGRSGDQKVYAAIAAYLRPYLKP